MYVVVNTVFMSVQKDMYTFYNSLFYRIMIFGCFCITVYRAICDLTDKHLNIKILFVDFGLLVVYIIYASTTVLKGKKFLRKMDLWIITCLNRGSESKIYRLLNDVYLWMWVVFFFQGFLNILRKRL